MRRRLSSILWDAVAAAAIFLLGVGSLAAAAKPWETAAVDLPALVAIAFAVLVRRRMPVGSSIAFVAAALTMTAWGTTPEEVAAMFMALLLFPYAVGAYAPGRRGLLGLIPVLALVPAVEYLMHDALLTDVFPMVLSLAAYTAGRVMDNRVRLAAELHEAAVRAEEERAAERARSAADERRRIAREMHDIVAHSISVMVVQAGGARRVLETGDPERAAEAAGEIERTGREALIEMRRLLGVLHPAEAGAAREPQPGMSEVGALVERARNAGLPVEFHQEGEPRELPAGMDLAAYRILQESLTNALKYADRAPTEVHVVWSDEDLRLHVADRGPGPALTRQRNGTGHGSGHGIIGMGERVRLYGGEVHAGRRRGGGFEVIARIPMTPQETT